MKCDHCKKRKGEYNWHPRLCADNRKSRSKWLCEPCDHMLNRLMLEFFNDPQVERKMAEYTGGSEQWGEQSASAPV